MRRHSLVPFVTPCLLVCLVSCGGPEQQARASMSAPVATVSTPAGNDGYRRALNESDLATQIDLLVDLLRLGSVEACARLIALGRWNELALVDPRQPSVASWAGSPERVGALTRGQVHGVWLANWAIRNAALLETDKRAASAFRPLRREMVRALEGMWEGPLDDPMLLSELYWLISEYADAFPADEAFRLWLLPRFLDGAEALDRLALHARLVQFTYLVSKDSEPDRGCESVYDKAVALAHEHGFIAVELALKMWRPYQMHPGTVPPLNGHVLLPDEMAQAIAHMQALLDLSRRAGDDLYVPRYLTLLAWLRHPDRLRFDGVPAYPTASWPETAQLYAQVAEAALVPRRPQGTARPSELDHVGLHDEKFLPGNMVHAYALINQAWCLHQGIARDPAGVPQAIALYEKAIALLMGDYGVPQFPVRLSSTAAASTLRWLRGELMPTRLELAMYDGIAVPDAEIFPDKLIYVVGMRVGPHGKDEHGDHGIGEDHGWWDEAMERRAMHGSWKDGRRDGVWTWWHADGSLAVTGSFRAGIQIGRWRFLKPDGTPFLELDAGDGPFTGEVPIQNPDGTTGPGKRWQGGREILPDPPLPQPSLDGWQVLLYPDGRKRAAGAFAQGLETDEWTWWHKDCTTVKERAHMRMGIRDGEASIWSESGELESTGTWRCGLRDGDWAWFSSGKKLYTKTFRMGETIGERDE